MSEMASTTYWRALSAWVAQSDAGRGGAERGLDDRIGLGPVEVGGAGVQEAHDAVHELVGETERAQAGGAEADIEHDGVPTRVRIRSNKRISRRPGYRGRHARSEDRRGRGVRPGDRRARARVRRRRAVAGPLADRLGLRVGRTDPHRRPDRRRPAASPPRPRSRRRPRPRVCCSRRRSRSSTPPRASGNGSPTSSRTPRRPGTYPRPRSSPSATGRTSPARPRSTSR